jgi:hypothetical protein
MRLASASPPENAKVAVNAIAKIADQIFIMSPSVIFEVRQSLAKAIHLFHSIDAVALQIKNELNPN